ncbi:MAG TPA: hypothetical protein VFC53_14055 [Dehalococcoidia bacterium]|nr:hypothetical protein [Dehalococcoidia bacterium]
MAVEAQDGRISAHPADGAAFVISFPTIATPEHRVVEPSHAAR